jgi:hypothetical protein
MISSWILITAPLVLIVVAVIVVVFAVASKRARMREDPAPVVRVTLVIAALWGGVSTIGAIAVLLTTLIAPHVTITVPVSPFWPELPAGMVVSGTDAERVGGDFTSVELSVAGISAGVRVMWAISQFLAWLVPGTIAALIAVACFQLLAGRTFAPVAARMATVTAVVVMVGGVASQVLGDIAGSMASGEVLGWTGATWPEVSGIDDPVLAWVPQSTYAIEFPFWPIAAGLAFAALATIFASGAKLQRDTEGLV